MGIWIAIQTLIAHGAFWWFAFALIGLAVYAGCMAFLKGAHPPLPTGSLYKLDLKETATDRYEKLAEAGPKWAQPLAEHLGLETTRKLAELEADIVQYKVDQLKAKQVAEAPPEVPLYKPTAITFVPGEPTRFKEYEGQAAVVELLATAVSTVSKLRAMLPYHPIFIGPAGMGKTTLAKVTANEIRLKLEGLGLNTPDFISVTGSDIPSLDAFDALIRRWASGEGNVLFIDEVHTLAKTQYIDKLLLLLSERKWLFQGDRDPTELPDGTLLAGTTDYGNMSDALKRRFKRFYLQPMTRTELVNVIKKRPFPIADAAAERIVSVTYFSGAPWEGLTLRMDAQVYAEAAQRACIVEEDVERVITAEELDEFGLRRLDRSVIHVLLKSKRVIKGKRKDEPDEVYYVLSKTNLMRVANVDPGALELEVLPRLLNRGFARVTSRGVELTDAAVIRYLNAET